MSEISARLARGTYTVEATTLAPGQTGSFTLAIAQPETDTSPETDTCLEELGTLEIPGQVHSGGVWPNPFGSDCDSETRQGSHAKFFSFTLTQEAQVTIDLEGTFGGADPYLYLRRDNARSGEALNDHAADNDAGGGKDSQAQETLAAGTYTVEATTYGAGQTGLFSLTITVVGATTPGECVEDLETLTRAVSRAGEWTSDCESTNQEGGYARYFRFELADQESVRIELRSHYDTILYLLEGGDKDGDEVAQNDNIETGVNSNSRIIHTLAAGTYVVEATTFNDDVTGFFFLNISTSDRDVLEDLYNATGGENWNRNDNWVTDVPIQFWYGVTHDGGRGALPNWTCGETD